MDELTNIGGNVSASHAAHADTPIRRHATFPQGSVTDSVTYDRYFL
jgi:hypothetical protein